MAGPLSVEDILAKQKADKEALSKPKFLTKAERAAIALQKRAEEVSSRQVKEDEERKQRIEFEKAAEEERRKTESQRYGGSSNRYDGHRSDPRNDRYGRAPNGHDYRNGPNGQDHCNGYNGQDNRNGYSNGNGHSNGNLPTGPRGQAPPSGPRGYQPGPSNVHNPSPLATSSTATSAQSAPSTSETASDATPLSEAELAVIQSRYLGQGGNKKKPRIRKLQGNDKKFVFDWSAAEDTSASEQGTWVSEVKSQASGGFTFGGRLAGFDEGGKRRGQESASTDNHADALERRHAGRGNTDERHWSDKPLDEMKDRDWRIFREDYSIAARGGAIPNPLRSWRESAINKSILDVIDEIGYKEPSPIQRQAIPIGMQNRDLVGIAKTGSGKTAAFVIPMLDYIGRLPRLNDDNRHLGPYALILAPTRELAQQIEAETTRFATPLGYKAVSIVGGRAVEEQQFNLRDGAEIVIATPGRLKDMLDKSMLVMSQCRYVVMDEADRMVDLGFEIDLNFILDTMPAGFAKPVSQGLADTTDDWKGTRVTTLFSATMPPAVERLTRKYLRKPATVTIGTAGEAVDTVEQRIEFIHGEEKKKSRLIEILRSGMSPPIIVFVNQKKTADQVVKYVSQAGLSGTTLHSGKNQEQREQALASLRDGSVAVLVATDLAGRGIDVPDVSLVINWQMADTIERYVHRIGRTGRAGKMGVAITFLSNDDDEVMFELRQEVEKSPISKMNPELARHEAAKQKVTREMKRKREEEEQ